MKQNRTRGEWVGCSDLTERKRELKRNHESEELKALKAKLDAGWTGKVTGVTHQKPKRQRIQKPATPRQVVVTLGGEWTVTLNYEDYQKRGAGLKIMMRIY